MSGDVNIADVDGGAEESASTAPAKKRMSLLRGMAIGTGIAVSMLAAALLAMVGLIYAAQDRMIYMRTPKVATPAGWTLVDLGEQRRGWWTAPKPGARTILFFHGNATTVDGVIQATLGFRKLGYGVLAPEYPGYAGLPGESNQASITRQADLAMDWLGKNGVRAGKTVVYGNSLGSGPAIHAALRPHQALVIVSGLSSLADVARFHYGPIGGYVRDKWLNAQAITGVKGHKIIIHGTSDNVVPFQQGELLARKAGVPLIVLPAGHEIAYDEQLQNAIATSIDYRAKQAR